MNRQTPETGKFLCSLSRKNLAVPLDTKLNRRHSGGFHAYKL